MKIYEVQHFWDDGHKFPEIPENYSNRWLFSTKKKALEFFNSNTKDDNYIGEWLILSYELDTHITKIVGEVPYKNCPYLPREEDELSAYFRSKCE